MKQPASDERQNPLAEETEIIKSLLTYPSLEKVFDRNDSRNLAATRQKMRATIDDLERVIRRGSKSDAERAAKVIEALQTTLDFLDEIENLRRANQK